MILSILVLIQWSLALATIVWHYRVDGKFSNLARWLVCVVPIAVALGALGYCLLVEQTRFDTGMAWPLTLLVSVLIAGNGVLLAISRSALGIVRLNAVIDPKTSLVLAFGLSGVLVACLVHANNTALNQLAELRMEAKFLAFEVSMPRVAAESNAALLYESCFEVTDSDTKKQRKKLFDALSHGKLDFSSPEVIEYLKRRLPVVEKARQAASLTYCYFERDWSRPGGEATGRPDDMADLGKELVLFSHSEVNSGRWHIAIPYLLAARRLADHMRQDPPLLFLVFAAEVDNFACDELERWLNTSVLNAGALGELQVNWTTNSQKTFIQRSMRFELASGLGILSSDTPCDSHWKTLLYRAFLQSHDIVVYRRTQEAYQLAIANLANSGTDELDALDAVPSYQRPWMAQQLLPDYGSALKFIYKSDARCRLAWLGIMTKRFRLKYDKLPGSAVELCSQMNIVLPQDPLSNASFQMTVDGESVYWASVGKKLAHTGDTKQEQNSGGDEGLIIRID